MGTTYIKTKKKKNKPNTYLNNRLLLEWNWSLVLNICEKEHASYTGTSVPKKINLSTVTIFIFLSVKHTALLYISIANFIFLFDRLNNFNSLVTLQLNEECKFDIISLNILEKKLILFLMVL